MLRLGKISAEQKACAQARGKIPGLSFSGLPGGEAGGGRAGQPWH